MVLTVTVSVGVRDMFRVEGAGILKAEDAVITALDVPHCRLKGSIKRNLLILALYTPLSRLYTLQTLLPE